jgi:hypothetical protein
MQLTCRCTVVLAGTTPASSSWYAATSERDILPFLNDGNDASSEPLRTPAHIYVTPWWRLCCRWAGVRVGAVPLGACEDHALGLADDRSGVLQKLGVLLHRRHLHGPVQRVPQQLSRAIRTPPFSASSQPAS